MILLSIGRIGWKKRSYENKTLVKFQLNVSLDKVIYINSNISIVVAQKIGLPSAENSH
jgi:hypothetical protein